jgi:hypothetical protein
VTTIFLDKSWNCWNFFPNCFFPLSSFSFKKWSQIINKFFLLLLLLLLCIDKSIKLWRLEYLYATCM